MSAADFPRLADEAATEIKPRREFLKFVPWLLIGAWALWLGLISLHGLRVNIWGYLPSFERAGQFGDAFGSVNALLAALAASGAFLTLREQRKTSEEQSRFLRLQTFENTFFQMLSSLQAKLEQIVVVERWSKHRDHEASQDHVGANAFRFWVKERLLQGQSYGLPDMGSLNDLYKSLFDDEETNLGHYFRVVYHALRHIDGSREYIPIAQRYEYVRLLRAQLSHSELLIILANCRFAKGRDKFLPLAVKYDLFQNLKESEDPLAQLLTRDMPAPDAGVLAAQASTGATP